MSFSLIKYWNKKIIKEAFSVLSEEDYKALTNKQIFDVSESILKMEEALKPRRILLKNARKQMLKVVKSFKDQKSISEFKKIDSYKFKKFLTRCLFNFNTGNVGALEGIKIFFEVVSEFRLKKNIWDEKLDKDIRDILETSLQHQYLAFTDNIKVFKFAIEEFLDCWDFNNKTLVNLCSEITDVLFIRVAGKEVFKKVNNKDVIESVFALFTKEELVSLKDEYKDNIYNDFFLFSRDLISAYPNTKQAVNAAQKLISPLRKHNEIITSRQCGNIAFKYLLIHSIFCWK